MINKQYNINNQNNNNNYNHNQYNMNIHNNDMNIKDNIYPNIEGDMKCLILLNSNIKDKINMKLSEKFK